MTASSIGNRRKLHITRWVLYPVPLPPCYRWLSSCIVWAKTWTRRNLSHWKERRRTSLKKTNNCIRPSVAKLTSWYVTSQPLNQSVTHALPLLVTLTKWQPLNQLITHALPLLIALTKWHCFYERCAPDPLAELRSCQTTRQERPQTSNELSPGSQVKLLIIIGS